MDYLSAFAISGSGMAVEKVRLDVTALNLANAHSTRTAGGTAFQPLTVVSTPRQGSSFSAALAAGSATLPLGAQVAEVRASSAPPRVVYEPSHPDADSRGFVSYPGVNTAHEMLTLIAATRAYQANVAALNAAKFMVMKALDIGGNT
jgi:flagellar basal-body rod protein FlgC